MILIADSGSTKTHWKLLKKDHTTETYYTKGLNPHFTDESAFSKVLTHDLNIPKEAVTALYFYGSGCGTKKMVLFVKNHLKTFFASSDIFVYSDLFGAARALLGNNSGIACILGTGSVSCVYNGSAITANVPSLGYILGDEGGGAALGKELLRLYFYNKLPEHLHRDFTGNYGITREEVLERVYHQSSPNAYLATFSKFIRAHHSDPFIHDMVYRCFKEFFLNHVTVYPGYKKMPLVCTGSISFNLKDILSEVAEEFGTSISKILKEPMEGLVEFHKNLSE
ncbi:MAG TPA: ATPase [Bacteroidales bacterium]|nr:ATPase [Bacteroidales bacterium]